MDINYKEIVEQILSIVNEKAIADKIIMDDENISLEEGKEKFAKNNELFRLDVCKRLQEAGLIE